MKRKRKGGSKEDRKRRGKGIEERAMRGRTGRGGQRGKWAKRKMERRGGIKEGEDRERK